MNGKMILLTLSMLLILSCQVWQNAWKAAGRTRGFPVVTITDTNTPAVTNTLNSSPTKTSTPTINPITVTALFLEGQSTQNAANAVATEKAKSIIATSTASAKKAQATVNAINVTAAAKVKSANSTATAKVKSANSAATAIVRSANATATAKANSGYATEIAKYTNIDPNELVTSPNNHINESVIVRGLVFYVISNTDFLIWLDGVSNEAVRISMVNAVSDIYENEYVTVYGIVAGEACGANTTGVEICQPQIVGVFYEKK